jgi:hypothetical protein
VPSAALALHWKFDEASGTAAADSSGNGYTGTHTGATGTPTISNVAPALTVPNPHSLTFDMVNRHAVRYAAMPAALRPANNFTLAGWYRATTLDLSGSEVVSGGDHWSLRVRPGDIELGKRITNSTGGGQFTQCRGAVSGHLDGNWHHIVGVVTPSGMRVYYDGALVCSNTQGSDIRYDRGPDLWVGRHGNGNANMDFGGEIDDVRVYLRALNASDVAWLYQGKP